MQLDLVDDRQHARLVAQPLDVLRREVAHADRGRASLLPQPHQRTPRVDVAIGAGDRPVDEVEVHAIQAEALQARVERPQRLVEPVVVVPDLGRDEDVVTCEAGRPHTFADLALVAVQRGRVHVPVPGGERSRDEVGGDLGRHLVGAHPELRDRGAVGQGHAGRCDHGIHAIAARGRGVAATPGGAGRPRDCIPLTSPLQRAVELSAGCSLAQNAGCPGRTRTGRLRPAGGRRPRPPGASRARPSDDPTARPRRRRLRAPR